MNTNPEKEIKVRLWIGEANLNSTQIGYRLLLRIQMVVGLCYESVTHYAFFKSFIRQTGGHRMSYAIFRIKKLKTPADIKRALGHAMRTRDVINADPSKKDQNQALVQGDFVTWKAKTEGLKIRKNAVLGIDVLMTSDHAFFTKSDGSIDHLKVGSFMTKSLTWLQRTFGPENIVSARVHLDEHTPHLQALIVPIVNNRLNAKYYFDGKAKLQKLQDSYYQSVGNLGLERGIRGSPATHQEVQRFYSLINSDVISLPQRKEIKKWYGTLEETEEEYLKRIQPMLRSLQAKAAALKQLKQLKIPTFEKKIRELEIENQRLKEALGPLKELRPEEAAKIIRKALSEPNSGGRGPAPRPR